MRKRKKLPTWKRKIVKWKNNNNKNKKKKPNV